MVMLLLEFTKVSAIDNKYLAVFSRENITLHEKYFVFMCFSQQGRFCSFLKGISLFSIFFWAAYKEIAFIWIQCNCYVAFLCMSYCPSVSLVFWVAFSIEHNSDGALYPFFFLFSGWRRLVEGQYLVIGLPFSWVSIQWCKHVHCSIQLQIMKLGEAAEYLLQEVFTAKIF